MQNNKHNRGISLLGIIFIGFILILVLSYFGVSIRGVVESPEGQDNINYVQDTSKGFWEEYLEDPVSYLWNDIWIDLFWEPFVDNMKKIKNGTSNDIIDAAPNSYDESNPMGQAY